MSLYRLSELNDALTLRALRVDTLLVAHPSRKVAFRSLGFPSLINATDNNGKSWKIRFQNGNKSEKKWACQFWCKQFPMSMIDVTPPQLLLPLVREEALHPGEHLGTTRHLAPVRDTHLGRGTVGSSLQFLPPEPARSLSPTYQAPRQRLQTFPARSCIRIDKMRPPDFIRWRWQVLIWVNLKTDLDFLTKLRHHDSEFPFIEDSNSKDSGPPNQALLQFRQNWIQRCKLDSINHRSRSYAVKNAGHMNDKLIAFSRQNPTSYLN